MPQDTWKDWIEQAEHDLEVAHGTRENGWYDTSVAQSQQAADKAVKALWIREKNQMVRRTHAVDDLAREVGAPPDVVAAGTRLARAYFASRYPDMGPAPPFRSINTDEANARLRDAEEIMTWVRQRLENR